MEVESYLFLAIHINPLTNSLLIKLFVLLLLLLSSALISGSEVAFFSLDPEKIKSLQKQGEKKGKQIIKLLSNPNKLLATILISNNFVNIGIVILSAFISNELFVFDSALEEFIYETVIVTFLILLFGEVIPKVYANIFNVSFALFMVYPMLWLEKIFSPLAYFLISSSTVVNKILKFNEKDSFSIEDLSKAIEISQNFDEKKMLTSIVQLEKSDVKKIMVPRVDVVAIDYNMDFEQVKKIIKESGFSRYPVYKDNLDNIVGILVAKDLINFIDQPADFRWQRYIREPFFVPESKKIDDLLVEFQKLKTHMAIVTDEYGGFSGIITLEDVLEEIFGEIVDEYDEIEVGYKKLHDGSYEFDGKFLIQDFYRVMNIQKPIFEENKGSAETLAGLLLEIKGDFPQKGEKFIIGDYEFKVAEMTERHIEKIIIKKIKPETSAK